MGHLLEHRRMTVDELAKLDNSRLDVINRTPTSVLRDAIELLAPYEVLVFEADNSIDKSYIIQQLRSLRNRLDCTIRIEAEYGKRQILVMRVN